MRLRTSARIPRLAASLPQTLAAAVLATISAVPLRVAFAQEQQGYPAGSGTPQPGPGAAATDTGAAGAPAPRRGALGWWTGTSLTTQATLTNNSNYGVSAEREGDLIIELTPSFSFNREGSRLRVNGFISLNMLAYVNGTQANEILPQASVLANLEAIENLFFIDASVIANQSFINPFLPRTEFSSTTNQYTYVQGRLAPYFKGNLGQNVSWLIRSDNTYTWNGQTDASLGNVYYVKNLGEIVRAPTPLGLTLRLTNDITRVQNQIQPDQTLNAGLAIVDYAFTPQFTFGLRGGYETTNYTLQETSGPIYGANLAWKPSPLTSLIGYWEERFYGPSYNFQASHRQRRVASSASFYRTISSYPQAAAANSGDWQPLGAARCDPDRAFPRSDRARQGGAGPYHAPRAPGVTARRGCHLQHEHQHPDRRQS